MQKSSKNAAFTGLAVTPTTERKRNPTKANPVHQDAHDSGHSSWARLGLFVLLTGTVLFAGGALFIKFKLEGFRASIEQNLEERIGASLVIGTVSVNGFRGVRIENLRVEFRADNGPQLDLFAPLALVHLDLNQLIYGQLKVDRIILDNSEIVVRRPLDSDWYDPAEKRLERTFNLQAADSFRVMGRDCVLHIQNLIGESQARITDFSFDASRLEEAEQLAARVEGNLSGDPQKRLEVKLTAASGEDFDLRIQTNRLTSEDVNLIFPASQDFVESGETRATVWINGRPDSTVVISVHALFDSLLVRDQPDFIDPASGTLSMLAYYSNDTDVLTIANAKADSEEVGGDLGGTIDFSEHYPLLDLRLAASKLPSQEVLNQIFENTDETYGTFDISLAEDQEVYLKIEGTTDAPRMLAVVAAENGFFHFTPKQENLPEIELTLSGLQARWNPDGQEPLTLSCAISGGTMTHEDSGLVLTQLYGAISLQDGVLIADPVRGIIRGSTLVGTAEYNIDTNDADVTFSGTLPGIEDTMLADLFKHTSLAGNVSLQGQLSKRGDILTADAQIDATQAEIIYQWWITKPAGVGANAHVAGSIDLNSGGSVRFDGEIARSQIEGEMKLAYDQDSKNPWRLDEVHATSEVLDIDALDELLHLPYSLTGGSATNAYFDWRSFGDRPGFEQDLGGFVDDLEAAPELPDAQLTAHLVNADIRVHMESEPGTNATASIKAESARIPSIGERWLIPIEPPPPWEKKYRHWTFNLALDTIYTDPWTGIGFLGEAFATPATSGFTHYSADIGEGYVEGSYSVLRETNTAETHVMWQNVPAQTMLEHLSYPGLLAGSITGGVDYLVDHDDPSTLSGTGRFDIRDGEFSAEFLYSLIRGQTEDDFVSMPASLAFQRVQTDVRLEGDRIETPSLTMEADAFDVTAAGHYFRDGDMDYMISVELTPQAVRQIPAIAQYFNVSGMRIAQQDLNLTFHVTGPTFNPSGKVAGLPSASVTLVSGALEVATEAARVIDLPRRILIDLVKTGGGIVGP